MTTNHTSLGLLHDKVAFVTGAGRGIGAAAAKLFAAEGARVLLAARTERQLKTVTDEIRAAGGTADYAVCDLGDTDSVRAAVGATVERFGCLDVAFNNGAVNAAPGPMDRASEADADRIYQVNFRGQWAAIVAEVEAIRAGGGRGAIVNTSSVGSLFGNPELPMYGAMKRALNSLTESAAVTYGPEGIRVNAITPGSTITEMLQHWDAASPGVLDMATQYAALRRSAEPDEIAQAAAWLLSDRASYVTGAILRVDGGLRI